MKIGIVGYQGSGKSSLYQWLTGVASDPAQAHKSQSAMATVREPRVPGLCDVYQPKKITEAALELVDTPGLSRSHEESAARLAAIRESGALVVVVAAFGGADALSDLRNLEDDFLLADLDIVSGRVERLRESVKKPRPNRDEQLAELAAIEPLEQALSDGKSLRELELTPQQQKATRSFQLFTEKPRLVVINIADDDEHPEKLLESVPGDTKAMAVSVSLQLELAGMDEAERSEFCGEMGVEVFDRDQLVRDIMDASGQMLFFTAGEKEVRTWMIPQGATAVEAAGEIHTDLARGFIRAAVMNCDDLIRLGGEREIKAANLLRQEPKDYVIADGDVVEIRHN